MVEEVASSVASLCGEIAPSSDSPLHSFEAKALCKSLNLFQWNELFPVLVRFNLISVYRFTLFGLINLVPLIQEREMKKKKSNSKVVCIKYFKA